jgi:hypothetical protein
MTSVAEIHLHRDGRARTLAALACGGAGRLVIVTDRIMNIVAR